MCGLVWWQSGCACILFFLVSHQADGDLEFDSAHDVNNNYTDHVFIYFFVK